MPQLEVVKKTIPPITVAAIRLEIPTNDQAGELLPQTYDRLCQSLNAGRVSWRGPAMALWHSSPDMFHDEVVDVAFPVDGTPESEGEVQIVRLPETVVASVVHTGPFSEFQQCHVALSEWLAKNGCRLEGAYREIYHTCEGDQATTEVQYPLAPA